MKIFPTFTTVCNYVALITLHIFAYCSFPWPWSLPNEILWLYNLSLLILKSLLELGSHPGWPHRLHGEVLGRIGKSLLECVSPTDEADPGQSCSGSLGARTRSLLCWAPSTWMVGLGWVTASYILCCTVTAKWNTLIDVQQMREHSGSSNFVINPAGSWPGWFMGLTPLVQGCL